MPAMKFQLSLALGVCVLGGFACDGTQAQPTKADAKTADAKATAGKTTEAKAPQAQAEAKIEAKAPAPDAKQAPQPAAAPPPDAARLTLGKAKIFEKKDPGKPIEIAEDGTVAMEGEVGAKVTADGKVTSPDGSKVLMQVGADGKVTAEGSEIGVTLADAGATLEIDGKTTTRTFAPDGSIVVDPKPDASEVLQHDGCVGPVAKTCALVVVGVLFTGGPPTTSAAAAEPPTAIEAKAIAASPPAPK